MVVGIDGRRYCAESRELIQVEIGVSNAHRC